MYNNHNKISNAMQHRLFSIYMQARNNTVNMLHYAAQRIVTGCTCFYAKCCITFFDVRLTVELHVGTENCGKFFLERNACNQLKLFQITATIPPGHI